MGSVAQRLRRQRHARAAAAACGALLLVGAATPAPVRMGGATAELQPGLWPRLGHAYTLLDPSLALPPLHVMAPDLSLVARPLGDDTAPSPHSGDEAQSTLDLKLDYRHAQLGDLSSTALRDAPSTGFSRQLDTDVLALGMWWRLAGNQVGVAYQLQSARGSSGDAGLSRFLPGSEAATQAFTLGVTREFGGGLPPPAPPPLLVLNDSSPDASPPTPPPSPAP